MYRPLILATSLLVVIAPTQGQDAIPLETVTAVKKATVFVRVEAGSMKGSGSGFVVAADKGTLLIATNYHVLSPLEREKRSHLSPAEVTKSLKAAAVTVVFDGGTATEQSFKAEAIAADPEADLAVLRVTDVKNPPKPIDYTAAPKLSETMSVYTFGFPFGQALAFGKGAPAITVGKGSVSSLRLDDNGDLSLVQLDVALNPGNSGGPVVNTKGQLVGVAVAMIKNGQGIGFAIPASELAKLLKGRLGGFRLTASRAAGGKMTVRAQVAVIDPADALRAVTLHYLVIPSKGKKPDNKELVEKQPGAKKASLKIEGGVASGELTLDTTEGELLVQAVPEGGPGAAGISAVRNYGLAVPRTLGGSVTLLAPGALPAGSGAGEVAAPIGWKEYTAADKTFKTWLPEKGATAEKPRNTWVTPTQRVVVNSVVTNIPGGPMYSVDQLTLIPHPRGLNREESTKLLRNVAAGDGPGAKVVSETDTRMGKFPGTEFIIERGEVVTRVRGFVVRGNYYLIRVVGTHAQIESPESSLFLDSYRLQLAHLPPPERGPRVQGGGHVDFRDVGPSDALLVGLEVGLGKFFDNDIVVAVRPIYRTGDREVLGEQYGTVAGRVVKLVAKPDYAVGTLTLKTGLGVDGVSLVFMKIEDDQLDPADSYESEWVGGKGGGGAVKIGGDGTPVVGLLGRTNPKDVSGLGLAYLGEKPWPAGKPTRILGGGEIEFREAAPDGGLLVGLEIGLTKFFDQDIIRAFRPVYRVGDKESLGDQYGTDTTRVVKVVAKPGYAVGAILTRTGAGIDGMSVIFMKVTDGKLDPRDNYESEWVGIKADEGLIRLTGEGTLVVGVATKGNAKDCTGLGLLLKEAAKK